MDQLEEIKAEIAEAEKRLSLERSAQFRFAMTGSFDAEGFFKREQILIRMKWLIFKNAELKIENEDMRQRVEEGIRERDQVLKENADFKWDHL